MATPTSEEKFSEFKKYVKGLLQCPTHGESKIKILAIVFAFIILLGILLSMIITWFTNFFQEILCNVCQITRSSDHTACTGFQTAKKLDASNLAFKAFEEPKTTKKFQFSQGLFQKIHFLYFFLHKSWIWRTLGHVMNIYLLCILFTHFLKFIYAL